MYIKLSKLLLELIETHEKLFSNQFKEKPNDLWSKKYNYSLSELIIIKYEFYNYYILSHHTMSKLQDIKQESWDFIRFFMIKPRIFIGYLKAFYNYMPRI